MAVLLRRSRLFTALAALAWSAIGNAASFDCQQAAAREERAICASRILSERDVELAVRYRMTAQLLAMGGRGALADGQQAFLRRRRRCGADQGCLLQAYDRRIAEVMAAFEAIASRGPF